MNFQLKFNKLKAKYEKIKDGSLESLALLAPEGSELKMKLLSNEQQIEMIDLETADARTVGDQALLL